jgi:hypothetical protein
MESNMIKKSIVLVFVIILLGYIVFKVLQPIPLWETNAKQINNSFNKIGSKSTTIDNLSDFTTFEWDTLYSFAPYTSEDAIYKVIGYKWDKITSTVSEGMNQVVFLKDGKVVCYIDGYPDKYNVFFDFGQNSGDYFKLISSDKLSFNMTVINDGIRKFAYVK